MQFIAKTFELLHVIPFDEDDADQPVAVDFSETCDCVTHDHVIQTAGVTFTSVTLASGPSG